MWLPKILGSHIFIATFRRENKPPVLPGEEKSFSMSKVPSRFMHKFICRLRLNEVSRQ